jgi:hypothetical protein
VHQVINPNMKLPDWVRLHFEEGQSGSTVSDRREAIRARLNGATPGSWQMRRDNETGDILIKVNSDADGNLIAYAPTDIAWLLEENARLQIETDGLSGEASR